jgi:Uri superfamily endonuclease
MGYGNITRRSQEAPGSMNRVFEKDGIYLLIIGLSKGRRIQIGRLGHLSFHRGSYGYVGSARRGMKSRLSRHLKEEKPLHWHIDYLLQFAEIEIILFGQSMSDKECALAHELSLPFQFVPGFGSTDCRCMSHLFFSPHRRSLLRVGYDAFGRIGLTPRLYWKKRSIRAFDLDVFSG